jgi:hypothetical protein
MRRALGSSVLFSLLVGAVLLVAACAGSSPATTAASASTSTVGSAMSTASTITTTTSRATTTSAVKSGKVGTEGNPVPIGTEAAVGNWKVKVTSADFNADAKVKNAPAYQPPDPGSQYVLINLEATYEGAQPDSLANGLAYQIAGGNGDRFNSVDIGLDNSIENTNALEKGASVSGPLVFAVPSDQIDAATFWMAPGSAVQQEGIFFALK